MAWKRYGKRKSAGRFKRSKRTYKRSGKSKTPAFTWAPNKVVISRPNYTPRLKSVSPPFQDNKITKLRWAWEYQLGASLSNNYFALHSFRLNSLYDPDYTGSGHQPRFFDQLFSISGPYYKYRVMSTAVKVTFVNAQTAVGSIGIVAQRVRSANTAVFGSVNGRTDFMEMPYCKHANIGSAQSNQSMRYFKSTWNIGALSGCADPQDNEDLEAPYNYNPAEVYILDIAYWPLDGATTSTIKVLVEFDYVIQCLDPATVGMS